MRKLFPRGLQTFFGFFLHFFQYMIYVIDDVVMGLVVSCVYKLLCVIIC